MASARKSVDIDVPLERFFEVLQDYARYPEFLPEVKAIRLGPRVGATVEVTYKLDVKLKVIEYTLQHVEKQPDRIDWHLVRGEFMKSNDGSWTLARLEGGGTTATYAIELNLGALVPHSLEKALAEQGLPNMLANFKARAEKLHRPKP
jgi:ribosome-associated toxin RatA of RatAB toxin-antitoxin module